MRTFALVPVNRLSEAKTRLSSIFSPEERRELVICMLKDVLDSLEGLKLIIISPGDLREILEDYTFQFILEEKKQGLNAAVERANRYAIENGAEATLFVPADTPLIKKAHVEDILRLGEEHPLIISPSRRGGTGVLFRRPPDIIDGRFTPTSFSDHRKEASSKGVEMFVYDSFFLSLDIDTPEDAEEFMLHGRGTRTYDFLKKRI
jgi:2-phospho-L-lactate guanylyltransferase